MVHCRRCAALANVRGCPRFRCRRRVPSVLVSSRSIVPQSELLQRMASGSAAAADAMLELLEGPLAECSVAFGAFARRAAQLGALEQVCVEVRAAVGSLHSGCMGLAALAVDRRKAERSGCCTATWRPGSCVVGRRIGTGPTIRPGVLEDLRAGLAMSQVAESKGTMHQLPGQSSSPPPDAPEPPSSALHSRLAVAKAAVAAAERACTLGSGLVRLCADVGGLHGELCDAECGSLPAAPRQPGEAEAAAAAGAAARTRLRSLVVQMPLAEDQLGAALQVTEYRLAAAELAEGAAHPGGAVLVKGLDGRSRKVV